MVKGRVKYMEYREGAFKVGMTIFSIFRTEFNTHVILRIEKDGFVLDGFTGRSSIKKLTEMGMTYGIGNRREVKRIFFFSKIVALNELKSRLEEIIKDIDEQINVHTENFLEKKII